jgi:hypothetical protein
MGFEPMNPCGLTVFKTVAFVHSATPPHVPHLDCDHHNDRPVVRMAQVLSFINYANFDNSEKSINEFD